ncbi:tetratricopeptide repeat protein [Desulfoferrobacter suflitae]|uniref:tetratricopeptide repeat protein n=1 Tax=Desulfoferrobacter suflitae TaxID=2865782 RepID=UPI0021648BDC|nr:tetratricopeptide repeat protein [Desulfoferrobacter suflitae]MCK8604185.1 tetratricopeptide repeat protein [Desulfoferrobacter suflitae]
MTGCVWRLLCPRRLLVLLASLGFLLAGCATLQRSYDDWWVGRNAERYMQEERYAEGIRDLGSVLHRNPQDASAAYWMGRYYLAMGKPEQAVSYLTRAVELNPQDAEAHFWLGVCHWALFDFSAERRQYEQALTVNPGYKSARLYLGHHFSDQADWSAALAQYEQVLTIDPTDPEALFYCALALHSLKRTDEARLAWINYLNRYPDGRRAIEATKRLNSAGDFTYRNMILGLRKVTLRTIQFEPGTAQLQSSSLPSLDVVGSMLSNNQNLTIHVVVYVDGRKELARKRAFRIYQTLLDRFPRVQADRLLLSWFGTGERIKVGSRAFREKAEVNFITQVSPGSLRNRGRKQ